MRRLGTVFALVLGLAAATAAVAAAHPEPNDIDGDGVLNELDNCVSTRNADQNDEDRDGPGDRCDTDADADGVPNQVPYVERTATGFDNCPLVPNPGQEPAPQNPRFGVVCYVDSDGDTHPDPLDNCPDAANRDQADYDYDRTGDVCDPDDDEDGEFDAVDNCQFTYNYDQADADGDGRGTACDDSEATSSGPPGSGGPAASDRSAPTLRLALAARHRLSSLGAGLPVRVRCNEGCAVSAELTVNRATARRLRLGRRATTVARGTAVLGDRGSTYVFMRFKRGLARRLAGRPAVRAVLEVTVADQAGNSRTTARTLRLSR
jgi:Thrombospondin type 3 repeat